MRLTGADPARDLMHWEHIACQQDADAFNRSMAGVTPEVELRNLTDQIYALAPICRKKMRGTYRAMQILVVTILFWFLGFSVRLASA